MTITACSSIRDKMAEVKGSLIGNNFNIYSYDYYGNKTIEFSGKNVNIATLNHNEKTDENEAKYDSSVLEITINGQQIVQVGNTLVFAESGLDMIEGYEADKYSIETGASLVPIDRYINNLKNKIGKEKTIIIYTPMGIPLGVYEGKKVFATVPKDLPKMTRLNIDGKSLYIHRANYMIIDTKALK